MGGGKVFKISLAHLQLITSDDYMLRPSTPFKKRPTAIIKNGNHVLKSSMPTRRTAQKISREYEVLIAGAKEKPKLSFEAVSKKE